LHKTLYQNINLRGGVVLQKGKKVEVFPIPGRDDACAVVCDGKEYKLRYSSVFRPISERAIGEAICDGVCESVLGCQVEPDGHDEKGFPSWLLALGMI
jgi:hypothetical protein